MPDGNSYEIPSGVFFFFSEQFFKNVISYSVLGMAQYFWGVKPDNFLFLPFYATDLYLISANLIKDLL